MNERIELARVIHTAHCLGRVHNEYCEFSYDDLNSAAAVLAAGYRKEATA